MFPPPVLAVLRAPLINPYSVQDKMGSCKKLQVEKQSGWLYPEE